MNIESLVLSGNEIVALKFKIDGDISLIALWMFSSGWIFIELSINRGLGKRKIRSNFKISIKN